MARGAGFPWLALAVVTAGASGGLASLGACATSSDEPGEDDDGHDE